VKGQRLLIMANISLRYLPAKEVENGSAAFGAVVHSADGMTLGRLEGFMMDPASRTLRYFVIDARRGRRLLRRLIPFVPAWLDRESNALHLLADLPSTRSLQAQVV
jgi:hypothetical protein